MYGMIPKENTEKCDKAPPVNKSNMFIATPLSANDSANLLN